jgi:hypothetical protein
VIGVIVLASVTGVLGLAILPARKLIDFGDASHDPVLDTTHADLPSMDAIEHMGTPCDGIRATSLSDRVP